MAEFRPQVIDQVFGQPHLYNTLGQWEKDPKSTEQVVLLYGPYGTGKTSVARILASKLVSHERDLQEIDAARFRGIDDTRNLAEMARFSPIGNARVFIIDELHRLTKDAQAALLKVLEEPPRSTYFFLFTTEISGLLPALASRCQKLEFRLLNAGATQLLVKHVWPGATDEMAKQIHRLSGGHARDAVKIAKMAEAGGKLSASEVASKTGATAPYIREWIISICNTCDTKSVPVNVLISDEHTLGMVLDEVVDTCFIHGIPAIRTQYHQLLQTRALKKAYQVTPKEQFFDFLSLVAK